MVPAWAWLALASWLCLVASATGNVKFEPDDGGPRRLPTRGEDLLADEMLNDSPEAPLDDDDASAPFTDPSRYYFLTPFFHQDPGALRVRRAPGGGSQNSLNGMGNRGTLGGSTLSIVNPIDVLRQRVMLEFQRMRMRENDKIMKQNREFMKTIGRKRLDRQSQMQRSLENNGWDLRGEQQDLNMIF